jgi:hypothetical protein
MPSKKLASIPKIYCPKEHVGKKRARKINRLNSLISLFIKQIKAKNGRVEISNNIVRRFDLNK